MKICPNCGGSYKESEPKCPYCGMINETGAEQEYSDKLNKIRNKLDNVDELAVADYKGDLKLFFKIFFITLVIAGVFTFAAASARYAKRNRLFVDERANMDRVIAEVKETRSYTDKWDELYDSGDYEAMYESVYSVVGEGFNNYDWQHYKFYTTYAAFRDAENRIEECGTEEGASKYKKTGALHAVLYVYYSAISSRNDGKFTEEEAELFNTRWEELVKKTCETLHMTEKELDNLRIRANSDSYPSYSEVSDYAKERWGE